MRSFIASKWPFKHCSIVCHRCKIKPRLVFLVLSWCWTDSLCLFSRFRVKNQISHKKTSEMYKNYRKKYAFRRRIESDFANWFSIRLDILNETSKKKLHHAKIISRAIGRHTNLVKAFPNSNSIIRKCTHWAWL